MQPNLKPGEDFQHFLDTQIREMQTKAAALTEAFADSTATVSSRDGAVTVTVAPNGALRNIQLGHRACELGPTRLTASIMEAVGAAQRQTANSVVESVAAITGEGDSTDFIRSFLPPPPDEPAPQADPDMIDQRKFVEDLEPERPPAPPAMPAPPPPPVRRRRPVTDDEDEVNPW
jgi:DNA-binding protein YbaB